jgi:hypothetical protein
VRLWLQRISVPCLNRTVSLFRCESLALDCISIQAVPVKPIYAVIAMLPALALADVAWVKIWEGDMALPISGSAHVVTEADVTTQKHTGAITRVLVRTSMTAEKIHLVTTELETFDCVQATYTIQTGSVGPGPVIPVKLPAELAMYQFACR